MENLEPTNNQQPITAPAGRDTVLHEIGRVIESLPAYGKHHILRIHAPKSAAVIKPGQFLHIYCNGPIVQISERLVDPVPEPSGLKRLKRKPLLRRPISVFRRDSDQGEISILFRQVGLGTEALSAYGAGDNVDILGPLGRGFDLDGDAPALLIAGGIGIAPLTALAAELLGRGRSVTVLAGMRDALSFPLLLDNSSTILGCKAGIALMCEMGAVSAVASEAGEPGTHPGLVTGLLEIFLEQERAEDYEAFVCGPGIMMARVSKMLTEAGVPGQALLEERMGCGIGACMACVCRTRTRGEETKYSRVCVDGPVFDIKEVVW